MHIVKLTLLSKNNKTNGFYLYSPIVYKDGNFYRCQSVKAAQPIKAQDINKQTLVLSSVISPEYYRANNLKHPLKNSHANK